SVRFKECVWSPNAARMSSRFFVRKIPRSKMLPPDVDLDNSYLLLPFVGKECQRSLAWKAAERKEQSL
ncbi:MAG TPA: hypothetical protein VL866_08440, partial [Pyrinomonadaceae bacterium]|nr:hypothetical protein [Pyrinomonadaceae bacterium]